MEITPHTLPKRPHSVSSKIAGGQSVSFSIRFHLEAEAPGQPKLGVPGAYKLRNPWSQQAVERPPPRACLWLDERPVAAGEETIMTFHGVAADGVGGPLTHLTLR